MLTASIALVCCLSMPRPVQAPEGVSAPQAASASARPAPVSSPDERRLVTCATFWGGVLIGFGLGGLLGQLADEIYAHEPGLNTGRRRIPTTGQRATPSR